jgi:hypothetical protein
VAAIAPRTDAERIFAAAGGVLVETTDPACTGLTLRPDGGIVLGITAGLAPAERDERIAAAIGRALLARCDRPSLVATLRVVFAAPARGDVPPRHSPKVPRL